MKRIPALLGFLNLGLALLACRPVIAIGWPEFIILVILIAFLLGPTLYKLYRFLVKVKRFNQAEEKKKN